MRLAAEELRAELEGALGPAALERSVAALRGRLADYFRLESAALAEQKAELEALKAELTLDVEAWLSRQNDLQHWAAARQAEFEQHAARQRAREEELDRIEKNQREQEQLWREERFVQQQQIRRLQAELRGRPA